MARILVTEKLAERGLAAMAEAGHDVDVRLGLSPIDLLGVVPGAHALVVRSATKVTAEVIGAGRDLAVVGWAGPGVATELLSKIFAPYSSTKSSGTGLGLAITRKAIEEHGGSVHAENLKPGFRSSLARPLR